jgi:hypothetical protein
MACAHEMSPQSFDSNALTIKEILHCPLAILKIFGVFIEWSGDKFKLTRTMAGKILLNAFSMTILVCNVTRMLVSFAHHEGYRSSDKLTGRIVFAVMYVSVTIMYPIFIVTTTKTLPEILSKFSNYQQKFGFAADVRRIKRIVTTLSIASVISFAVSGISIILLTQLRIFDESGLLISRLLPFGYQNGYVFDLISIADTVISHLCIAIMNSEMITVLTLSQIIIKEFQEVNRKIYIFKEKGNISAFELQRLREHHYEITKLLQTGNTIMQLYVFCIYMLALPGLCFTIYGIVYGHLDIYDIIYLVSTCVMYLTGMILMTGTGAKINSEVISSLLL